MDVPPDVTYRVAFTQHKAHMHHNPLDGSKREVRVDIQISKSPTDKFSIVPHVSVSGFVTLHFFNFEFVFSAVDC